jgi:hypothetical protein
VEGLALEGWLDDANADDEVTEALAIVTLSGVALDHGLQNLEDLLFLDRAAEQLVQALAMVATTEVHVVSAVSLANEGDFGEPRTRATVRATCHAHGDAVLAKTSLLDCALKLRDELRKVALRLSHSKTASGEGHTGSRAEAKSREVGVVKLVLGQEVLHLLQILLVNTGQNQVLVTSKTELALVDLRDLIETSLHRELSGILNATVLNEHGEVPLAILILLPAEGVDVGVEVVRLGLAELLTPVLFNLALEDVDAHGIDGVLQTSVLAVGTVTIVALDEHDLLASNVDLVLRDESKVATSTRVGLLHVMSDTHTTTSKQVETDEVTIVALDGNETDVVSVDVGVVVRRNGDGNLELSGKVGRAVKRLEVLDRIAGNLFLLAIALLKPDLVVSSGGWKEVIGDLLGARGGVTVEGVELGQGGAHDGTVNVTASGDGSHERLVDGLHSGLQLALHHTVELEGLTGGELDSLVSESVGVAFI